MFYYIIISKDRRASKKFRTQLAKNKLSYQVFFSEHITNSWKEGKILSNPSLRYSTVSCIWIKGCDRPAENINQWKVEILCIHIYAVLQETKSDYVDVWEGRIASNQWRDVGQKRTIGACGIAPSTQTSCSVRVMPESALYPTSASVNNIWTPCVGRPAILHSIYM